MGSRGGLGFLYYFYPAVSVSVSVFYTAVSVSASVSASVSVRHYSLHQTGQGKPSSVPALISALLW